MSGSNPPLINIHPGANLCVEAYQWLAGTNPNNAALFTLPCFGIVLGITGWLSAIETGAATVTPVRTPAGSTIAQGVAMGAALNVGSVATGGVGALVPVTLTQFNLAESLKLLPGDTIGLQSTGSFSASAGNISIYWTPQ